MQNSLLWTTFPPFPIFFTDEANIFLLHSFLEKYFHQHAGHRTDFDRPPWEIESTLSLNIPTSTQCLILPILLSTLCVIFMILVSLENIKKCALGGCTITSKTKINIVRNLEPLHSKKFQTTLILAFEAQENETKIVKITHSALMT